MNDRHQFNSYVTKKTADFARDERIRTGKSIGTVIDNAVEVYSMEDLTKLRFRLQERLNFTEVEDTDIVELKKLKQFLELYIASLED